MKKIEIIIKGIKNPRKVLCRIITKNWSRFIPSKAYLGIIFWLNLGYKLSLDQPKTYNEKLQWLKLNYSNPICKKLVDKYEVREYISEKIGSEYLIPLLGVWDKFEDINFENLPISFVLKCTHDSGGVVICKDKNKLDINSTRKRIERSLKINYYYKYRESPYKELKPRIIAEKYMIDKSGYELKDYKFFCFNGIPKALFIATDRQSRTEKIKFDFYDMEFNHLPFTNGYENATKNIEKPSTFEEMKIIASRLSKDFPHVRVDLYSINGMIYFGEMTFYHFSGMVPFNPKEWDYKFGEWLDLYSEVNN